MKNVKRIAEKSKGIIARDRATWITLYYSVSDNAVYMTDGEGRRMITQLINPNSEQDIIDTVEAWKRL